MASDLEIGRYRSHESIQERNRFRINLYMLLRRTFCIQKNGNIQETAMFG